MTEVLIAAIGLNLAALLLVYTALLVWADTKRRVRRHPLARHVRRVRKHTTTGPTRPRKARAT